MSAQSPSAAALLVPLAKVVIEAALEAELEEHLADQTGSDAVRRDRRNARNGTRPKTVRTTLGPVTIEVPRDRWGTFDPLTVGKWQRDVVRLDRLLLQIAADGAAAADIDSLLARAYPHGTPCHTLARIAAMVRARLRPWHVRRVAGRFPVLAVHLHAPRAGRSGTPGTPVVSVVGIRAADLQGEQRRELLSLRAMPAPHSRQAWCEVANDLRRRQLRGPQVVVGAAAGPFRDVAAGIWPLDPVAALSA